MNFGVGGRFVISTKWKTSRYLQQLNNRFLSSVSLPTVL